MNSTQADLNATHARGGARSGGLQAPRLCVLLAAGGLVLGACQALPPVVSTALLGFGQDVLAAAAHNFAPQYAASMQNLFFAMAETATGVPFTQQAAGGYDQGAYGEDVYAQQGYDDGGYAQQGYDDGGYDQQSYHDSGAAAAPAAQYGDTPAGVALEVALLAQQSMPDGQVQLRPIQDGDVLRDGRGDPARGDKIKIYFSANCACFVYVIAIDATGYVAQIFPEGDIRAAHRVQPGVNQLVPGGTTWWGLDDYRGVEQVYFIASRERRRDIEDLVADLAGRRPELPADYRPVSEPAIVAMTRGLVQVQSAAPTTVPTEYGAEHSFSPTSFQGTVESADLVITRWFRHE